MQFPAFRRGEPDGAYAPLTLVDTDLQIVAFTETSSGELLVLDYDFTGQVYELVASDAPDRYVRALRGEA